MQYENICTKYQPLSLLHTQPRQNCNITKAIISTIHIKNGQYLYLNQYNNCYQFLIRHPIQDNEILNFYYFIEKKQKLYLITCTYFLPNFKEIFKKIGYYNFLSSINDWNAQKDNSKKIIWCSDQKIIKIRSPMYYIEQDQILYKNLLQNINEIQTDMKQFVIKICYNIKKRKLDEKVNGWAKYKTQEDISNLLAMKRVIESSLQNKDGAESDKQSQTQSTYSYKDEKIFNKLESQMRQYIDLKEKQAKSYIVRGIEIKDRKEIDNVKNYGTNCLVKKYYYEYNLLPETNSINKNSNDMIIQKYIEFSNYLKISPTDTETNEQYLQKQSDKKSSKNRIFIEKSTKQSDTQPFDNEKMMIWFMRLFQCEEIAQYYLQVCKDMKDIKRILIKYYPKEISSNFNPYTKFKILFKIALSLYFLHDKFIVHRDIKLKNIPIDTNYNPKLIDFGSSYFVLQIKNKEMKKETTPKLRTTRYYNKFYSECHSSVKRQLSQEEYELHPLFDIYAFGKIIQQLFQDQISERYLGETGYDLIIYLSRKCSQENPRDRLIPLWILMFLIEMQQTKKTYFYSKKINVKLKQK